MAEDTETTLNSIYARIAPKIQIPGLNVIVLTAPDYIPAIDITTPDDRIYVSLSLSTDLGKTHHKSGVADPDIASYRWEYMDCITGAIIESELDYMAPDEEVIAFFKHTLETDDSVMKL